LSVDVLRFRDLTAGCPAGTHGATTACTRCVPALEVAATLGSTSFMEGFIVSNAHGFDDWQFAEREALRREMTEALDRLTAYHAAADDWAAVVTHARSWLQVDRLSEIGARRLMGGLATLGKRSEALRLYDNFRRTMEDELGLLPDETTAELAEEIRKTDTTPSVRRETARRTSLPAPLMPFVGRERTTSRLAGIVEAGEDRLVTLVGLGGIGKTSLALQVGRHAHGALEGGVFFVPLGGIHAVDAVTSAMAESLGLAHGRDKGGQLALALKDYLREREILLIVDEAEGVASLGERLVELLADSPRLRCLVTSRVPLGVSGETVIALHGLDHPEEDASVESIAQFDAIRLLRVAERRVAADSEGTAHELQAMARVARLLDGFPLGLEMAGAWRGVFSWQEIADRIASNLDFLVHTHRDVPPRHRNLRAVYEQAWMFLSQEERTVLRRLAVFHGGFTIGAAEQSSGASPAILASLAKRCLIRRVKPDRYHVHELVRQFSLENLRAAGTLREVLDRHATYYVERVDDAFARLKGPDQLTTLREFQRDLQNIRTAWLHAAATGRPDLLRCAAHGLFFYFDMRAHFEEGARVFLGAIERLAEGIDPVIDGLLRVVYGWFAQFTAETDPRRWIDDGLRRIDDTEPYSVDHALANMIAAYANAITDRSEVRRRLTASIERYRTEGDRWGEALAIAALAGVAFREDREEGVRLAEESLRLRREIGDHWGEALNLATLGGFAEAQEKWDLARVRYHQSQRLATRIAEDLFMAISAQLSRARIATIQGDYEEAQSLAEGGLRLAQGVSERLLTASALRELGRVARAKEELAAAAQHLEEAFALLEGTLWRVNAARCAELLADVARDMGDADRARGWDREVRALDPEGERRPWTP
jgi:predicted ATPase